MSLEITCTRNEADHKQILRCKNTIDKSSSSFQTMSKILTLAGNEVRLKILFLLDVENELCPCDIADILEMSVPAVSQHIRKIKDAGIISSRREGQTLFYSLNDGGEKILSYIFQGIKQSKIAV
ncbi:metalloregulator ArsR/SmtB family transcription factor [Salegentibacter mishustinae]|jgi:DNA-binding transcriptional ArsR family regulator|uniref:ArsR/SmtB family transcription factor n=2 Tax=Salegentibacter mishustinae TaxID=270918 RepID=UPI000CCE9C29|nr:metalloregulator ArsR/SmtB family transcription factor [Salegentibacter mishustinae]PNW21299.1 ArsR family transcriptional regulator [Salegentibacter mishustinae]PZX60589.1 DNA-binding transcriptional ArsR family regulator [Salegentibacter mishustinae]UBZ06336.1 metalloregulator ArsR/SmtB family transcription factor [Salegentibacter mishustinae]